jgi:phytoene synthase
MQIAATDDEAETAIQIRQAVGRSGSSFLLAMRLLPKTRREAMYAVYAFCRAVDDIADDDDVANADKLRELEVWRDRINALYETPTRPPQDVIARALLAAIRSFGLQRADFIAVIDGMEMDAREVICAPGMADLLLYCDRVAGAVGRLSVRIFGPWQAEADIVAEQLGLALQLTNILRDLVEDAERGRLYLPREALLAASIPPGPPEAVLIHPRLPEVCQSLATRAHGAYAEAARAMAACPRSSMRPARMMGGAYRAILDRLSARGWTRLDEPVRVSKLLKIWLAIRHGFF